MKPHKRGIIHYWVVCPDPPNERLIVVIMTMKMANQLHFGPDKTIYNYQHFLYVHISFSFAIVLFFWFVSIIRHLTAWRHFSSPTLNPETFNNVHGAYGRMTVMLPAGRFYVSVLTIMLSTCKIARAVVCLGETCIIPAANAAASGCLNRNELIVTRYGLKRG